MNHLILGDPVHHLLDEARGFVGLSALTFTRIGKKHLLQPWLRCLTAAERIPNGKKGTLRGSGCPKVVGLSKEVGKQSSELRRTFIWVTLHHRTIHHTTIHLTKGCEVVTIYHITIHHITIHHTSIHHITIHHITIHHTVHLTKVVKWWQYIT